MPVPWWTDKQTENVTSRLVSGEVKINTHLTLGKELCLMSVCMFHVLQTNIFTPVKLNLETNQSVFYCVSNPIHSICIVRDLGVLGNKQTLSYVICSFTRRTIDQRKRAVLSKSMISTWHVKEAILPQLH